MTFYIPGQQVSGISVSPRRFAERLGILQTAATGVKHHL
ncbi:MAG: hypothetical protein AVDCRST_MAG58-687 [uncultured Rubrobacteraceae bacterium]|uniref:Uncharacterized protein n=1 Tax=uncultured Rubrobacteraceae bacterium TaxID=349277 RepID=A0A6J4QV49_9ACTN|nr:MAG: hypothetical protein AVDCRST_MAG58-687 [uncultured Rubrobacteraceae bacterium]